MEIQDIGRICDIAHAHDAVVLMDNTWATPVFFRPIEHGVDLSIMAGTKYLGGHSDVIGGVNVVADAEVGRQLVSLRSAVGSVPGPFDAYLVLRGVKTLALRMERHDRNGRKVAAELEGHPRVQRVHYPGLRSHPQRRLAGRQMSGFGGMLSFAVKEGVCVRIPVHHS